MTARLADLGPKHRLVLDMLSRGSDEEDLLGVELEEFDEILRPAIGWLLDLRLVDLVFGWRGSVWVQITPMGRRVRDRAKRR